MKITPVNYDKQQSFGARINKDELQAALRSIWGEKKGVKIFDEFIKNHEPTASELKLGDIDPVINFEAVTEGVQSSRFFTKSIDEASGKEGKLELRLTKDVVEKMNVKTIAIHVYKAIERSIENLKIAMEALAK